MNFKDKASQEVFKDITTKTRAFTQCFSTKLPVLEQADMWLKLVKAHCRRAFKLIRIRPKKIKPSAADKLISERNRINRKGVVDTFALDAQIATIISKEEMKKALMFKKFIDINQPGAVTEIWKLKKQLFPKKAASLPSAKLNYQNKIVSRQKDLIKLLGEEYGIVRLRKRPTHPLMVKGKNIRKNILKTKLLLANRKKSLPFKMEDLEEVLKGVKTNKAGDPEGITRTIFKANVIGDNLKESLLILFNRLKSSGKLPDFTKKAIVTTIPKKGKKILLKNERGIFLVSSVRSILMRLIYNLKSKTLDSHMTDRNVGGRKSKSGINHIWVMQSIIHENMSSVKKVPIVIQQYDYRQMFDGMDSSKACGDIYDYGVNDDHLTLIHEGNEEVVISVKTNYGLSKEYKLTSRIMQGDTWACAEASAQVDSFGKEMLEENPNYMYKYMGIVPTPLLGQVDDLIGVAEAEFKSKQLNSFVNV